MARDLIPNDLDAAQDSDMPKALTFLLVMATSPRGTFRRAGLEFSREWSPVQVGDEVDLGAPIPVLDEAGIAKLKAETMLVVKDASATDVEALEKRISDSKVDKDQQIAELQKHNADLEARLMRLELAMGGGKAAGDKAGKSDGGKAAGDKA